MGIFVKSLAAILLFALSARAEIANFYSIGMDGKLTANEPEFQKDVTDFTVDIDSWQLANVKVNIIVIPEGSNASFDNGHNIETPRRMGFTGDWGGDMSYKSTVDDLNVFAHEYGHAVFDTYIAAAIPAYLEVKKVYTAMSDVEVRPYQTHMTPEQVAANQKQYDNLVNTLKNNKEFLRIVGLTLPYHEVFADTIAVFHANSKNAISEALYNPLVKWNDMYAKIGWQGRDFGTPHDLATWEEDEVHLLFSPLRSQIGLEECWPKDKADQARKLKFLAQILTEQMKKMNTAKKVPVIADNKELIEKYKTICK
jgi:uncharacterized surface protein with fasciclin (FAS1) repeats